MEAIAKNDFTVNCSIMLTHLGLLERFAAVRDFGFEAVELWWPFENPSPDADDMNELVRALKASDVQLSGLNFFAGRPDERGVISMPNRQAELRVNLDAVTKIAEQTGCKKFNALYGRRIAESTPAEQDEIAWENLRLAADAVARIDGVIMLEPLSTEPTYPLKTAADAIAVIERVEKPNIGLLFDVYHLASNGDDVAAAIDKHIAAISHVQIADAPGRGAPGTGGLPIMDWVNTLREKGYTGLFGLEYIDTSENPFAWLDCRHL